MAKLLAPGCAKDPAVESCGTLALISITLVYGLCAQTFASRIFSRAAIATGELEAQPKYVLAPCSGLAWPESSQSNNSSPGSRKAPSKQYQEEQLSWKRETTIFLLLKYQL